MKKVLSRIGLAIVIIALTLIPSYGSIAAEDVSATVPDEESQIIFSQSFLLSTNPLVVDIVKWPDYQSQNGEEVEIILRVKNPSAQVEEVTYDLSSDQNIGAIRAVIDYDGPFGQQIPEDYSWNKVPISPGKEQYLYISFPRLGGFNLDFNVNIEVIRNVGARG